MRSNIVVVVAAVAAALLAGSCAQLLPSPTGARPATANGQPTASLTVVDTPAASTVRPSDIACPVTEPNGSTPPGEAQGAQNHGEHGIWTVLWPDGTVVVPEENVDAYGVLWMKFPWWRGPGVIGHLQVSGRERSTGSSVGSEIPDYGLRGFQASELGFPDPGCYSITASAGDVQLTFVTIVRLAGG